MVKRNKRIIIGTVSVIILILIYGISLIVSSEGDNELIHSIEGTVLAINDDLLRNDLNFTGVIITDDLSMGATSSITDAAVKAVKAGNDLIITTDYEESFNSIKSSVSSGTLSENDIDRHVFRILAWKYYKGLMFENQK